MELADILIEACTSLGHEHNELDSNRHDHDWEPELLSFIIKGPYYEDFHYKVELKKKKNQARFSRGNYPIFDFHDPDSIVLFKSIAMQMAFIASLDNFKHVLERFLEHPGRADWTGT